MTSRRLVRTVLSRRCRFAFSGARSSTTLLLAALAAVSLLAVRPGVARAGSDICYRGGSNLANFKLNGTASLDGSSIVLTQDAGSEAGSAMYQTKFNAGSDFHIKMHVRISTESSYVPADGMAFVMHNDPAGPEALGEPGGGVGYQDISNSVTIEFDTYTNWWDPGNPHIAITKQGQANHQDGVNAGLPVVEFWSLSPPMDPTSGTPFYVWIDHSAASHLLAVFVSNSDSKPAAAALTATLDLSAELGPSFYVGFTGSTGGAWDKHEFLELFATDTAASADASCCSTDADCASSGMGTVCDTAKHACGACSLSNVGNCTVGALSCDLSVAHNVCAVACDGDYASGATNACGSPAFPACRTSGPGVGSCAACAGDVATGTAADCDWGAPYCAANGYCGRCTSNADCAAVGAAHAGGFCNADSGTCVTTCGSDYDCGPENACVYYACVAKVPNGATIPDGYCTPELGSRLCLSGVCSEPTGTCGYTNGTDGCDPGTAGTVCISGACSTAGVCIPSGGCFVDGECGTGRYCARDTFTCTAKKAAGRPIPSDGLHTGVCNGANASATCATAACDAVTNTCASANQSACTAANECVSNLCSNAKCGAANGQTGCTPGTAASYCQSGACSLAGVCIPAVSGSCYVDGDCGAAFFCRRNTYACTADLNVGVAIPDDGLHGGACSAPVAAAVCATGLCDAATGTCAGPLGAACAAAADCQANICGGNGACGYPAGQGSCSGATASARCQSGACSSAGVCIPAASGSCWVDADCASGQFCDRADMACMALLPQGTVIPNDGLHGGTCAAASAVCAAGLCDATTVTCAAAMGTACTAANQCASNVCGSNLKCGVANGDGPCLVSAATAICQSGACGPTSHLCVPAASGSCGIDTDCAEGKFCDPSALTCVAKLVAGAALPNDRLHTGTCSFALAAAVCADGGCDSTSNTCARGPGAPCTSAAQCLGDVCNAGGTCGRLAGDGPCTPTNGATVCASGLCSLNAGVCLGSAANSCWVDADCAAATYCDRGPGVCRPKVAAGVVIPDDSVHRGLCSPSVAAAVCASGACNQNTGTCANPLNGPCTAPSMCANDLCGANSLCGSPPGGGSCGPGTAATVCQSAACGVASGVCVPADSGGCGNDSDCPVGQFCSALGLHCVASGANGTALPADGVHGACLTGQNAACASGLCNVTTSTCGAPNGTACTTATECVAGLCGRDGHCGLGDGESGCVAAAPAVCQSGVCTAAGVCGSMGCGADADCAGPSYCDASVGLCRAKRAAGQSLPMDGKHDGTCTATAAAAICATGACNATTSTCALPNGVACTASYQCAVNICGANGKCGGADGDPGCTPTDATACQSGLCSATGNRCLPMGPGRCAIDGDCSVSMYCDGVSLTCAAKLIAGAPLPNDGLHDGVCQPGTGAAVCASGMCNARANTCADVAGTACASMGTCISDICGKNEKCGIADGDGPCAASTQATDCQSGLCSAAAGLCVPQGEARCVRDADCPAGAYCNNATLTCAAKLGTGMSLPHDDGHDGLCSATAAALVCTTKQCNATTNTCSGPNASSCNTAGQCTGGVCGSDGKCGALDLAACTDAAMCRTGQCTKGRCGSPLVGGTNVQGGGGGCAYGGGGATGSGGGTLAVLLGLALIRRRRRR